MNPLHMAFKPLQTVAGLCLFTALAPPSSYAQFRHFDALSENKDCRIELNFPVGKFCGADIRPDDIRGWFLGERTPWTEQSMLSRQKFNFSVFVNESNSVKTLPILFLNPGTAKRFYLQMEVWSGKTPAGGAQNPFPEWLVIAN